MGLTFPLSEVTLRWMFDSWVNHDSCRKIVLCVGLSFEIKVIIILFIVFFQFMWHLS